MGTKKITEEDRKRFKKYYKGAIWINIISFVLVYFTSITLFAVNIFRDDISNINIETLIKIIGFYFASLVIQLMVMGIIGKKYRKDRKPIQTKIGTMPVNSRITIDYTGKKPTIKFDYPKKDVFNQVTNGGIAPLTALIFAGLTMLLLTILTIDIPGFEGGYPEECTMYKYVINSSNGASSYSSLDLVCFVDGKNITFDIEYRTSKFFGLTKPFYASGEGESTVSSFGMFGLFLLLFFFYKYVIGYIFAKTSWGHKNFPELNKKLHDRRFSCEWKPKDVKNNQLELPLFRNIYMDYEFTKEMSDNLQKVQIIEHPFNMITRKGSPFKKRKIKKTRNVYLWKAVFTFSKQPKTGKGLIRWT